MASTSINDRIGTGCLMLFALPFAAVGVGALYFAASNVLTWQRMTAWTAVPAEILTTNLEEHRDEDSTTHKATATYRYTFGGRDYVGNRAAISNSADNLGDFQQNLYAELRSAHARGKSVTAYVDPENPADATLNRDLRWPLLAMQVLFALVFGGVGFGLLFGARYAAKKQAEERTLQQQFPQEPWRWRKDWANARIHGSSRVTAYTATGFAVLWNLVSLPAALLVPREVANGNTLALVALLFPLIGIGLAAWAVRAWWQLRRFKEANARAATRADRARWAPARDDPCRRGSACVERVSARALLRRAAHERQRTQPRYERASAMANAMDGAAQPLSDHVHVQRDSGRHRRFRLDQPAVSSR